MQRLHSLADTQFGRELRRAPCGKEDADSGTGVLLRMQKLWCLWAWRSHVPCQPTSNPEGSGHSPQDLCCGRRGCATMACWGTCCLGEAALLMLAMRNRAKCNVGLGPVWQLMLQDT